MYTTKNTLPEKIRIQTCGMLQLHLANSIDLTSQAKQAHWNVKGPDFISLHELFDKISADSLSYTDTIAERIVQLGGIAEGTIKATSKRSTLPDYPMTISSGHDHVQALAHSLAFFGETARKAIDHSNELMDSDTADIFTEISRNVDKYLWFVEAHIQAPR